MEEASSECMLLIDHAWGEGREVPGKMSQKISSFILSQRPLFQ